MLSEVAPNTCGSPIGGTKLATIINTPTIRVERVLTGSQRGARLAQRRSGTSEQPRRIAILRACSKPLHCEPVDGVSLYCEPISTGARQSAASENTGAYQVREQRFAATA